MVKGLVHAAYLEPFTGVAIPFSVLQQALKVLEGNVVVALIAKILFLLLVQVYAKSAQGATRSVSFETVTLLWSLIIAYSRF